MNDGRDRLEGDRLRGAPLEQRRRSVGFKNPPDDLATLGFL
jgi:hypothetical protein